MIDPLLLRRLMFQFALLLLSALEVFIHILPLSTLPGRLPGPDILLALVIAWTLRRPDYVPVGLVAVIFFLTDMLFQRPPGLHAAFVVLGVEFLRSRFTLTRDMPFFFEWGMVIVVTAMILVAERLVLGMFVVEQVSFGKSVLRLIMTWAVYPPVVLVSVYVLGVRRLHPSDIDAMRQVR